jgi:hypothetical protein
LSGRDSGLFDHVVDRVLECAPRLGEWRSSRDLGGEGWVELCEGGVDDPRVGLGEEDGQSASLARELVAVGVRDPLDEPFAP